MSNEWSGPSPADITAWITETYPETVVAEAHERLAAPRRRRAG
jgi:hypothetical protein